MSPDSATLADRLRRAAADRLVGRRGERERLSTLIRRNSGPAVVFVSGPGGIGKTVLVASVVQSSALPALWVDGAALEPTPAGFLAAAAAQPDGSAPTSAEIAARCAADGIEVLVVDSYERLNLLDGWLRNEFLGSLPAGMTTVLISRRPPNVAWRTSPGWQQLTAELVLGPLDDSDATQLVARHRLPPGETSRAVAFGHGHPLALDLLGAAVARHPHLTLPDGPPGEVLEELFDVLLGDLSASERHTVEAASILRRVTQPLLAAVLGSDQDVQDVAAAWRTLRELPFTMLTSSGLEFFPLALRAIAGALEIRNPGRVRELRRRAATAAVTEALGGRSWGATADLLYLIQNPVIRDSYLPPGDVQHPVERATRDDLDAILEIVEKHDGSTAAGVIAAWWRVHAEGFVVGRGTAGDVDAFAVSARLRDLDRSLTTVDPVLTEVLADVDRRPLPPWAEVLLHRRALGRRRGDGPSPEVGGMVVDLKRQYFELRPRLARVYAVLADPPSGQALLRAMGFARVGESHLGGKRFLSFALDFGPDSVDGWLLRHVLVEVGALDSAATGGWHDGSVAAGPAERADPPAVLRLSAREREVLAVLAEGLTNRALAERLFISERTANRHLSNIFTKLGVTNRTAAARIAIEAGIVG